MMAFSTYEVKRYLVKTLSTQPFSHTLDALKLFSAAAHPRAKVVELTTPPDLQSAGEGNPLPIPFPFDAYAASSTFIAFGASAKVLFVEARNR